jgi:Na+-transporting NADH:ubiquinone oxidoreductase subunit F
LHCTGRLAADEKTFIPESDYGKVFLRARIYVAIYLCVIGLAIYTHSILPLMYVGLPAFYGSWLQFIYGHTQHAGLAENVLDHRLNTRTIYLNFINRFLYWEMNYHIEHHMFPMIPYHALGKLHRELKTDMPPPYNGLREAYREILPALFRQAKDPTYYVRRELPASARRDRSPA